MKALHVIVWGATGVTGKRVCKQLAARYQGVVKWAIAGRSSQKLTSLRDELAQEFDNCKEVPVLVADVSDKASVDSITQQAEVVLACAGPFAQYSDAVVESCVKQGSHFIDVTGETAWVRTVIDRFDKEALENDVKVVNFCGFDSVPADMGCFVLADYVQKRYSSHIARVLGCYTSYSKARMPFSGGTLASLANSQKDDPDHAADLYGLNPKGFKRPAKEALPDQYFMRFDKDFRLWTIPFIMQVVNKRVVHRSAALQPALYGPSFSYAESEKRPGFWSALWASIAFQTSILCVVFPPLRNLLLILGLLPRPGQGPTEEDEAQSWWKLNLYALVEKDASGSSDRPVIVQASISDDVGGYTSTARMATECAMCLVLDKEKLKEQGRPSGGVLTPSAAFGNVLVDRLRAISIDTRIL